MLPIGTPTLLFLIKPLLKAVLRGVGATQCIRTIANKETPRDRE